MNDTKLSSETAHLKNRSNHHPLKTEQTFGVFIVNSEIYFSIIFKLSLNKVHVRKLNKELSQLLRLTLRRKDREIRYLSQVSQNEVGQDYFTANCSLR